MYCPNCGAKILSAGNFCIECGTSLEAAKLVGESKYSTKKKTPQPNSALGSAVESVSFPSSRTGRN
ncbi:MAG: zinc-ribbon domain-containing protein [Gammaproteobacteria bacterium]|nr:zinc-ribbon domain-containing protein [Gammaproteobacteria bacterium]